MNAKHTPGPWFVKYGNAIYAADGYEIGVAYYAGNQHANMDDNGLEISRGKNQSEANARLIAAAPELLEALLGVVEYTALFDDFTQAAMRSAIAKATGA